VDRYRLDSGYGFISFASAQELLNMKIFSNLFRPIRLSLCIKFDASGNLTPEAYKRAAALGFTREELEKEAEKVVYASIR